VRQTTTGKTDYAIANGQLEPISLCRTLYSYRMPFFIR